MGRLVSISVLTTLMALASAAFSISHVLERFVIRGLDQQLDAEITILARAVCRRHACSSAHSGSAMFNPTAKDGAGASRARADTGPATARFAHRIRNARPSRRRLTARVFLAPPAAKEPSRWASLFIQEHCW